MGSERGALAAREAEYPERREADSGNWRRGMALSLEDLLKDGRLQRLFSEQCRDCALQLWVMQVKSDSGTENRLLYGRLLPYDHSSNIWHAPAEDHFEPVRGSAGHKSFE